MSDFIEHNSDVVGRDHYVMARAEINKISNDKWTKNTTLLSDVALDETSAYTLFFEICHMFERSNHDNIERKKCTGANNFVYIMKDGSTIVYEVVKLSHFFKRARELFSGYTYYYNENPIKDKLYNVEWF